MQITLNISVKKVLTITAVLAVLTATFLAGRQYQAHATSLTQVKPLVIRQADVFDAVAAKIHELPSCPSDVPAGSYMTSVDGTSDNATCYTPTMAERFDPRYQAVK